MTDSEGPLRTTEAILATLPDQLPGTYENLLFVPLRDR